jgi:hypothetical protein
VGLHLLIFFLLAQSLFGQATASQTITITVKEVSMMEIEAIEIAKAEQLSDTESAVTVGPKDGWLTIWYTCVNRRDQRKRIVVQTDAPVGVLHLEVFSMPASCGSPAGEVLATGDPKAIINNIPSCFTGRGSDVGVAYWFSSRPEESYRIIFRLEEEI